MSATSYSFPVSAFENGLQTDQLALEVLQSTITVPLDRIDTSDDNCLIWFVDALPSAEYIALADLVLTHKGSLGGAQPVLVTVHDFDNRTVIGNHTYNRDLGGILVPPSGPSFPASFVAKELFWRTDEAKLYRRNDLNTLWDAVQSPVAAHQEDHHEGGSDSLHHDNLSGAGTQTHAQLDSHVASVSNPHSMTAAQVGAATETQHNSHVGNTSNPHGTTAVQVGGIPVGQKGAANGVATLDGGGKVPASQIPAVALPEVHVVADATARLALTVQQGDEAIQLSDGSHWIYDGTLWQARPSGGGQGLPMEYSYSESESESSTSQSSYQQKHRHNFTVAGGTYLISWRYSFGVTSNNKDFGARVQLDDSAVLSELQERVGRAASDRETSGFQQKVLGAGAHFVDVDYQVAGSGNYNVSIRRVRVMVQRVA